MVTSETSEDWSSYPWWTLEVRLFLGAQGRVRTSDHRDPAPGRQTERVRDVHYDFGRIHTLGTLVSLEEVERRGKRPSQLVNWSCDCKKPMVVICRGSE